MTQPNSNHINLNEIARETMIAEGFVPDFPRSVDRDVAKLDKRKVLEESKASDLRHIPWSSIDNLTSKDLDQLEFVERLDNDDSRVMVGIADVDAFVAKGTAIDSHAKRNTTSVYTGVETFPMLPEQLSNDKTSLIEGEDRLAIVIQFLVTPDGMVKTEDIYPALVHNYSKMSYEVIGKWLDENTAPPKEVTHVKGLEQQVRLQHEVSKRLRQARKRQGALQLETIQTNPVMDERGRITDLEVVERNSARDLIESFMVAANSAMAEFLDSRGVVSLRRVVTTPLNWPRIVEMAEEFNETLPIEPDPRALSDFLQRRRRADPVHFPDLSLAVVKLLGPGDYVVQIPGQEGAGHFGLAVHRYTHSTAPNRRYPDLITQRLLKHSTANGGAGYSKSELEEIADHCNERESAARKVERKMRKVAAAVFMKDRIGDQFDAIVTGVSPKGTFARTLRPPIDGMVVKRERGLKVGQHARVKLLSVDPARGFIDFAAV